MDGRCVRGVLVRRCEYVCVSGLSGMNGQFGRWVLALMVGLGMR